MARFILTAELQLRAPTNANAVLQQIQRQLQGLNTTVKVNVNRQSINQINQINKHLHTTRTNLEGSKDAFEAFGKQAALAVRRFGAFVTATFAFRQLVTSIIAGVKEAIDFERQIVKIAQVTNSAIRDMKDLSGEITRLSTTLGVSSTRLAEVAQVLAQAGLTAKDTKIALDALAKSELSPTFEDIGQTTEGAIAIFQQFGKEAKDLEGILGALNAVSGKFAVESSDLISAVRRTGGAFKAAGGDLNELAALFTSVRATTRESADSIATGFRTIFTRIQRPRTINFLRDLGVELTDLKGQFVGPLEAVRRLSIALEKIPSTDIRFAQVIEELGGFRQVSKVIPLIQQFKVTQQALAVAQTGTTSLADDAAKAQAALAVQITKVKEEFLSLIREFSNDTTFRNLVDLVLKLASALIKVADAVRPLAPALATIGSIALGKAASKAVGSFGSGKGFLGNIFKFAGGGMVPGSGNKDTVPAMLQPGEFVLRKKAVEAIGPKNVARFNSGGQVFKQLSPLDLGQIGTRRLSRAGVSLEDVLSSDENTFTSAIEKLKRNNAARIASTLERKAFIASGSTKTGEGVSVRSGTRLVEIGGSSPEFGGLFLRPLDSRDRTVQQTFPFRNLAKDVQERLAAKLGKQSKTLSRASVAANLDFGFIEQETSKVFDKSAQNKIIDAAAGLVADFNPFGTVSRDTVAKITRKSNFEGALGSLFEAFTASVADVPPASRTSQQNFDIPNAQGVRGRLSHLFGNFPETIKAADVKLSATNSNIKSIVKKAARFAAFDGGVRVRDIGTVKDNITSNIVSPRTGEKIAKKASGGPAGGDTVPALLTPGEYVLDKDTVSRVGIPTLNKLNRKGFNKGGFVGKYQTGGVVGGAFSPTGFLGASVLLQTVNQFAGLNNEIGKLIGNVSSAAIQASVFTTAMKQSSFITEKQTKLESSQSRVTRIQERLPELKREARLTNQAATQTRNRLLKQHGPLFPRVAPQEDVDLFNQQKRESIVAERRQNIAQRRLQRRQDIANRNASSLRRANIQVGAAGIGAGIAGIGGDILSRSGSADIQAGGTGQFKSAAGGALSGAAQGALIGSIAGPWGAAAGAVVGLFAGAASAWLSAAKEIEAVQFGKTVEKFNLQLKEGISGAGAGGTSQEIRNSLNIISKRISTTSGEDRTAAEGAAKAALPELQQFFDSVAKNSKTIEDFEKTISRGTLVLFSSFSKIPFENLRKQYDAQIKSQQAAINAQNNLIKATDQLAIRIKNTTVLNRAIDEASVSLKGFSDAILSDGVTGLQDLSSILGGAGNITNTKRFETLTRATGASFGAAGQQTASDAIAANRVLTELPSVLLGLKDIQLLSEDAVGDFVDILENRLNQAVGGGQDVKPFIDLLTAKAGDIIGGEGKPQKLQERLRTDFDGAVKELSAGLNFAAEIMVKEFNHIAERSKFLADSLAKQAGLINQSVDSFNEALDIQLQKQDFLASQVPNARFSAGATENIIKQQLGNITREITKGDTTSIAGLSRILLTSREGILRGGLAGTADETSKRLSGGVGVTTLQEDAVALAKNNAELASNASFAAKALQHLVSSSQRLATAKQKELDAVEAERKSRLSLAEEFAFGGPEAQGNILENQNLISRISQGSISVQQLDPASLQKLGQFLDRLDPSSLVAGGGTAGEFRTDLVKQLSIGKLTILADPTKLLDAGGFEELSKGTAQEEQLRNELVAALDQAYQAQIGLASTDQKLADIIGSVTNQRLLDLDNTMKLLIETEKAKFTKEETARQAAAQRVASTSSSTAEGVSGLLGLPSQITSKTDIEKAKNAVTELTKLKKLIEEQSAFDEFRQTAGTLIRDKTLTESERQAGLLQEASRRFPGLNPETFKFQNLSTGVKPVPGKGFVPLTDDERLNDTRDAITLSGGIVGLTKEQEKAKGNIISGIQARFGIDPDKALSASQNLDEINKQLDILSKSDLVRFAISAQKPITKASGGFVSGPNIRKDIIPSMLMPGEFVMRKSAVDKIGVSTLSAMNNGSIAGFAAGGFADPEEVKRRLLAKRAVAEERANETRRQIEEQQQAKAAANIRGAIEIRRRTSVIEEQRRTAAAQTASVVAQQQSRRAAIPKIGAGFIPTSINNRTGDITAAQITENKKAVSKLKSVFGFSNETQPTTSTSVTGKTPLAAAKPSITTSGGNNVVAGTTGNVGQLQQVTAQFNATIDKLTETLGNLKAIQHEHTINGRVEVIINGDSALKALSPDLQGMVTAKISSAIKQWADKNFPGQTKEVDFSKDNK